MNSSSVEDFIRENFYSSTSADVHLLPAMYLLHFDASVQFEVGTCRGSCLIVGNFFWCQYSFAIKH